MGNNGIIYPNMHTGNMFKTRRKTVHFCKKISLGIPKLATLTYFMSRYTGTQKPLKTVGSKSKYSERDQHFDMGVLVLRGALS